MPAPHSAEQYRAAPPTVPPLTAQAERDLAAQHLYQRDRELTERRRQIRGLLLLALLVLVLSILRAHSDRVFPTRWWHPW